MHIEQQKREKKSFLENFIFSNRKRVIHRKPKNAGVWPARKNRVLSLESAEFTIQRSIDWFLNLSIIIIIIINTFNSHDLRVLCRKIKTVKMWKTKLKVVEANEENV